MPPAGELGEPGSLNASSYCPTGEEANISLAFLKFRGAEVSSWLLPLTWKIGCLWLFPSLGLDFLSLKRVTRLHKLSAPWQE